MALALVMLSVLVVLVLIFGPAIATLLLSGLVLAGFPLIPLLLMAAFFVLGGRTLLGLVCVSIAHVYAPYKK
jgi:hypothetical protein